MHRVTVVTVREDNGYIWVSVACLDPSFSKEFVQIAHFHLCKMHSEWAMQHAALGDHNYEHLIGRHIQLHTSTHMRLQGLGSCGLRVDDWFRYGVMRICLAAASLETPLDHRESPSGHNKSLPALSSLASHIAHVQRLLSRGIYSILGTTPCCKLLDTPY